MPRAASDAWKYLVIDEPNAWKRTPTGNLWTQLRDGRRLTLFRRQDGLFAWCIADGDGPRFSRRGWKTEGEAADAMWEELDGGERDRRGRGGRSGRGRKKGTRGLISLGG